jgi:hypothetical protein
MSSLRRKALTGINSRPPGLLPDAPAVLRLAGHDQIRIERGVLLPVQPGVASELRAVAADDEARSAVSRDDLRQLVRNVSARDRGARNGAKALLRDVVHDIEDAEAKAVGELVRGNLPTSELGRASTWIGAWVSTAFGRARRLRTDSAARAETDRLGIRYNDRAGPPFRQADGGTRRPSA